MAFVYNTEDKESKRIYEPVNTTLSQELFEQMIYQAAGSQEEFDKPVDDVVALCVRQKHSDESICARLGILQHELDLIKSRIAGYPTLTHGIVKL